MNNYIRSTTAFIILAGLAVTLLNYVVDPYCIFHFADADAARLSRVDQFGQMRLTKPWYVRQIKPQVVVIGTSRSAGVPPVLPGESNPGGYNLSVPGMSLYELRRFIEHAHAQGALQRLAIGLEFESFKRIAPVAREGFEEFRLARTRSDTTSVHAYAQRGTDIVTSLLSMPALARSVAALTGNDEASRWYFKDGTWETISTALTGRGGYLYVGKNIYETDKQRKPLIAENLAAYADILRFCYAHNIETRLFLTPAHLFHINLQYKLRQRERWQDFHRQMIKINNAMAAEADTQPFPVWGFNALEGIVDEPVLPANKAANAWFKDGLHFRKRLGARIIRSVWGSQNNFGTRLTSENIDSYLLEIDNMVANFARKNAPEINVLYHNISPML